MISELEMMWKKATLASFKLLRRHFPGGTEENIPQDSLSG
jgi:hypothetical protein